MSSTEASPQSGKLAIACVALRSSAIAGARDAIVAKDVLCQPPFVSDAVVVSSGDGEVRSPETGAGHSLGGGVVCDAARRGGDGHGDVALQ